ncbi:MAG: prepilin-type N-terminal cleavage/methylation domain-containing protein [Vulcanimicrobiota bacterium]
MNSKFKMVKNRSLSGLSLPELLVVLALLGLLLAFGANLSRSGRDSMASRVAALQVADLFRSLRNAAMASGDPVAVTLPSAGGTVWTSTCLQILHGVANPRLARVASFRSEGNPASYFLGNYSGPAWSSEVTRGLGAGPDLAAWNSQHSQDPVLYFGSDGRVFSNLEHDQFNYRLVVGTEIVTTGNRLASVFRPYTVSISSLGAVSVEAGLKNGAIQLVSDHPLGGQLSAAPGRPDTTNHRPFYEKPYLRVSPPAQPATLAAVALPSSNYTIPLGGYLTVECYANDPDGDPLYCRCDGEGPKGKGTFSSPAGNAMSWDPEQKSWIGRWTWRPPAAAQVNEEYRIHCHVYDSHGLEADNSIIVGLEPRVTTIQPHRLAFENFPAATSELWVCNWDGTDAHVVLRPSDVSPTATDVGGYPKWSPDNQRLLFSVLDGGQQLYSCTPAGTDLTRLVTGPLAAAPFFWDPQGEGVYTWSDRGTTSSLLRWSSTKPNQTVPTVIGSWPLPFEPSGMFSMHPSGRCVLVNFRDSRRSWPWGTPAPPGVAESWIVWTDHSNHPGKREVIPYFLGMEPTFECSREPAADDRIVAEDTQGALASWPVHFDLATCTTTLGAVRMLPGVSKYQSPQVSADRQWLVGEDTHAKWSLCLVNLKQTNPQPLIIDIPGTWQDNATFSR